MRSAAEGRRWVSGAGVVKSETPFGSGSNALSIVALTLSLSHSVATYCLALTRLYFESSTDQKPSNHV